MSNFIQNYNIILNHLEKLDINFTDFVQIRKPKLSNIGVLSMCLTAEYMSIDSECQLFRTIKGTFLETKIERSVYNRRRRNLFSYIELVRKEFVKRLNEFEDYFIVDSMPLEICKKSRQNRLKICKKDYQTSPEKGYCASQDFWFYGYKLHAICSVNGIFQSFELTKANVHDIHYLEDVKNQINNCVLLGDKGYLSINKQIDLFESANIKLETPMRKNQINYRKQPYLFRKSRKRIETLFSQLCDQFKIRNNYAKSFHGFKTRILSKITALTTIQFLNKFVFNRNINNIKVNLS